MDQEDMLLMLVLRLETISSCLIDQGLLTQDMINDKWDLLVTGTIVEMESEIEQEEQ